MRNEIMERNMVEYLRSLNGIELVEFLTATGIVYEVDLTDVDPAADDESGWRTSWISLSGSLAAVAFPGKGTWAVFSPAGIHDPGGLVVDEGREADGSGLIAAVEKALVAAGWHLPWAEKP